MNVEVLPLAVTMMLDDAVTAQIEVPEGVPIAQGARTRRPTSAATAPPRTSTT
jgi:hypothetical protein